MTHCKWFTVKSTPHFTVFFSKESRFKDENPLFGMDTAFKIATLVLDFSEAGTFYPVASSNIGTPFEEALRAYSPV